jgi:hypothetical protein
VVALRIEEGLLRAKIVGGAEAVESMNGRGKVAVLGQDGAHFRHRVGGEVRHLTSDPLEREEGPGQQLGGLPCVCKDEHGSACKGLVVRTKGRPAPEAAFQPPHVLAELDANIWIPLDARGTQGGRIDPATLLKKPAATGQNLAESLLRLILFEKSDIPFRIGMFADQFAEVMFLFFGPWQLQDTAGFPEYRRGSVLHGPELL